MINRGQNRTVLINAHRLSTIKHADQIVVMDKGTVAEVGSHDELLNNSNSIYKDLWNMQTISNNNSNSNYNKKSYSYCYNNFYYYL